MDGKKLTGEALRSYVVENIDRAIEERWIVVYFQPVARVLTGEICGMEALARWVDPTYGLLAPDQFIGALEDALLIHKLDSEIIRQICENYQKTVEVSGVDPVTVSFNLSRLDFQLCDIHRVIEDAIHRYRVPRDILRVEITESILDNDEERMHQVIDRFWERGFRVWMDDFGSGFSSLNVLKDYRFDTLKIDMVFLKDFNQRSREIVKSIVDMSKRIGVHTLAEGVETLEQFMFLKSIGCEKAQGYFFGKPMPYGDVRKSIAERGFQVESSAKRQYHHDLGRVNVLSQMPFTTPGDNETVDDAFQDWQRPIALVEFDGKNIRYLYTSKNYRSTMALLGFTVEEDGSSFADPGTQIHREFVSLLRKAEMSGKPEGTDVMEGEHHCFVRVRRVASYPGGTAFVCVVQELREEEGAAREARLSHHLRTLCAGCDWIILMDMAAGKSETLYHSGMTRREYNQLPLAEELRIFAREEVYVEDQDRYLGFVDVNSLKRRMLMNADHALSSAFRLRSQGGAYAWRVISFYFDGDPAEDMILCVSQRIPPEVLAVLQQGQDFEAPEGTDPAFAPANLWNNFVSYSDTAFFWKDKERRFVGVNRRFLEYYGLKSQDDLRGKTDEDMGWHIDPKPYKDDEERILREGAQTFMVPGNCIRAGQIRNIAASKMPLYQDGKVAGLMGYFLDFTEWQEYGPHLDTVSRMDPVTGSLGVLGLVEAVLRYQDSYALQEMDFGMTIFDIDGFRRFMKNYGREWGDKLLKAVSQKIQEAVGVQGVSGRINGGHFLVVRQITMEEDLAAFTERVRENVQTIYEVDGIPCTVYMNIGSACYSESLSLQKMLTDAEERVLGQE